MLLVFLLNKLNCLQQLNGMIILSVVRSFFPLISPNDIFRINAMILIRLNIDQYDVRRIINDLKSIKKNQ